MTTSTPLRPAPFEDAIDAFLAQPDLARSSVTTYRAALTRLAGELRSHRELKRAHEISREILEFRPAQERSRETQELQSAPERSGETCPHIPERSGTSPPHVPEHSGTPWPHEPEIEAAAARLWGGLAPASWNRNTAIVKSFVRWAHRHRHLDVPLELVFDRRREPASLSRAIPYAVLERLWHREDVPLREKTLWRLLYETAARAGEILALDVEDLELTAKRAQIHAKGGDLDIVHFQSGSARLLPRLLAGRRDGPVFLTDRCAPAGTPTLDICPVSGRARLSYRRAAALFGEHTDGCTLHQLRHSAITHLAEHGVSTTLLMAKSRHRSLRTLQRYARPGTEAVAALTAEHDPGRRR